MWDVGVPLFAATVFIVVSLVHGYRVGKESAPTCPECPEAVNLCTYTPLDPHTLCEIHAYPERGRYVPAGPYDPMRCCLENECVVSSDGLHCVVWDSSGRGWSYW